MIGIRFGLRGLKEQYELRRYPDSQINIVKIDDKDALTYREFLSKTRQWGYQIRVRTLPGYLTIFVLGIGLGAWWHCTGNICFFGPRGSYHWPRFYVQTDRDWQPGTDYWYTNRPVGKNTLEGYIEDIMKKGD